MSDVSIIIPAYNEGHYIGLTLQTLLKDSSWFEELIVVDDGSTDQTGRLARQYTSHVVRLPYNRGKGAAIMTGVERAACSILLFLDADLGSSASLARFLVPPVKHDRCDMTIAVLPEAKKGGFGLVKRWARKGIYRRTGVWLQAPLSGQRALRKKELLATYRPDEGFGFEVGLTIDYLKAGLRIEEVFIPFVHRERGKTVSGFWHRFKQGLAVHQALKGR